MSFIVMTAARAAPLIGLTPSPVLGRYDTQLSAVDVQGGGLPSDGSLIAKWYDLQAPPSEDAEQALGSSFYPAWDVTPFPALPLLLFEGDNHLTVDPDGSDIVGVGVLVDPTAAPGRALISRDTTETTTKPALELVIVEEDE